MSTTHAKRHAWSERNPVSPHTTLRRCWDCGLIKITRHETDERGFDVHWVEWLKNGKPFRSEATPPREPVEVMA